VNVISSMLWKYTKRMLERKWTSRRKKIPAYSPTGLQEAKRSKSGLAGIWNI